jgi:polar amino acid transport system substrate-binding protein
MPSSDAKDAARRALVSTGSLRTAINIGNPVLARRAPGDGGLSGISVDLANAIGEQLGVPVRFVPYASAGAVTAAIDHDEWDLAFLAIDPARAEKIVFSRPYLTIEGTYVVHAGSSFRSAVDVDQAGVTIAVSENAAYDLFLSRALRHATLVRDKNAGDVIARFDRREVTAMAGIRQALDAFARDRADLRVLPDRFMVIEQALAVAKTRVAAAAYLQSFIADAIASGFVATVIGRHA